MEYDIEEITKKAKDCLNCKNKSCSKNCPLGNDIPAFIDHIKNEEYEKAYMTLLDTTILSSICGRICPHTKQCEGNCIKGIKGNHVNIGRLEAYIGDKYIEQIKEYIPIPAENGKRVAIVGGGPCGITCGVFLRKLRI